MTIPTNKYIKGKTVIPFANDNAIIELGRQARTQNIELEQNQSNGVL
jgi:hypothetical protein